MNKHYPALARAKYAELRMNLRRRYLKFMGLQIKPGGALGKILCEWPNRIFIGSGCTIEDNVVFKITNPFKEENYIKVGDRVFIGHSCQFNCNTRIVIGDDCLIASNTTFVDTGHEITRDIKINEQPLTVGEIIIEDDVWIGTQCKVLKGVTIGKGCVIGAGSLVNKSIPAYQIWAGTPAKFIRNR
ncbi:MAG: acyltransferase [Chitinophagaceae bacterium]